MTDPGSIPDMPHDDIVAHAIFEAIETSLQSIGSSEAEAVADALVALSMDDEKVIATAIVAAVKLNPVPDDVASGDQSGARASTLHPLDQGGSPAILAAGSDRPAVDPDDPMLA